jgi:adenylate kinase family enzyme
MKGPFYQLCSKEGCRDDDFVTCAQMDLINTANAAPPSVLLLGKPRSGKTSLAKELSTRLELVHINVENWIKRLLEKIKAYEPPEDLEEGQEPPKFLSDLEEEVNNALKAGQGPSYQQTVKILKEEIESAPARTKGYILDLTFNKNMETWTKVIRSQNLIGKPDEAGRQAEFSHIIELECDDDEVKLRAKHMLLDPEDGVVYSRWERAERNKPKPIKLDEDGNPIEEEEEDPENAPKKLDDLLMVQRIQDTEAYLEEELTHYNLEERPAMDDLIIRLYEHQYLRLDSAGLTVQELADAAEWRLRPDSTVPLRPAAK